jgi:hypothetical protein
MKAQGTRVVRCAAMRCIDCDFDLERISEPRCPECGRAFDRHDAGTFIGPLYTRFSRWLAQAPGWPMFVLAATGAILLLDAGFGPGVSIGRELNAVLVCIGFGQLFFIRLIACLFIRTVLPALRSPAGAMVLLRWLAPPAIVGLAFLLGWLDVPRAVAFALDRGVLEAFAQGAPVQPDAWRPIRTWSGAVQRGAVWDGVVVWALDPHARLERRLEFDDGPAELSEGWQRAWNRRMTGETVVEGTVDVRLERLAVFPIAGTALHESQAKAWAYAPNAPDEFVLGMALFIRYRGDWFVSDGWILPLEDRP